MASLRERTASCLHALQAKATAGHQFQRCSTPPCPRPQSGQQSIPPPTASLRPGKGRRPRCRSRASATSWAGRTSSGSAAHSSPVGQPATQAPHQPSPLPVSSEASHVWAAGAPQTAQGVPPSLLLLLPRPLGSAGIPAPSILTTCSAAVAPRDDPRILHSAPSPTAHLRARDLSLTHLTNAAD